MQTQTYDFMFKRMDEGNFEPVEAEETEDYYDTEDSEELVSFESLQRKFQQQEEKIK